MNMFHPGMELRSVRSGWMIDAVGFLHWIVPSAGIVRRLTVGLAKAQVW